MGGEVGGLEFALKMKAANQAMVVRCAAEHSAIHRCWRVWASVASLLLREAGGALLQLELAKQQQRGVHTRLQAELAAEVAVCRVENIESRALLTKASLVDQLRPGHEIATDKELLKEQARALQAAHESAAAAHLAAAAHRVGERALAVEVGDAEAFVTDALAQAAAPGGSYGRNPLSPLRGLDNSRYDKTSLEILQQQEAQSAAALRRAGVEMRVLVRSLQQSEAAAAAPPSARGGGAAARAARRRPPPRAKSPASPRPAAKAAAGGAPKAQGRPPRARRAVAARSGSEKRQHSRRRHDRSVGWAGGRWAGSAACPASCISIRSTLCMRRRQSARAGAGRLTPGRARGRARPRAPPRPAGRPARRGRPRATGTAVSARGAGGARLGRASPSGVAWSPSRLALSNPASRGSVCRFLGGFKFLLSTDRAQHPR